MPVGPPIIPELRPTERPGGTRRLPTPQEIAQTRERARLGYGGYSDLLRPPSNVARTLERLGTSESPEYPRPKQTPTFATPIPPDWWRPSIGGRKVVAPIKDVPGPEDSVTIGMARRLQSSQDVELNSEYTKALSYDPIAAQNFRRLVSARLPSGLQKYAGYVADSLLQSPALEAQFAKPQSGVDLEAVTDSMAQRTAKLENELRQQGLRLNLPGSLTPHQRLIELNRQLSTQVSPTRAQQLAVEPMGDLRQFIGTLKAVVADAHGDEHNLFVAPNRKAYQAKLESFRLNEPPETLPYEGFSGSGSRPPEPGESRERFVSLGRESEQQPISKLYQPQQSFGRVLREVLETGDRTGFVDQWNWLAESHRVEPLQAGEQLTPEQQAYRKALTSADISRGLDADGLFYLSNLAGYDVSLASIQRAFGILQQTPTEPLSARPQLEYIASASDRDIAAIANAIRSGNIELPEHWAFQRPDSLGKAIVESIASGNAPERILMAANALYPDAYYRVAHTDVGEFGEWQPGLGRASKEVASDIDRLARKATPLRGQPGYSTTKLIDQEMRGGLARTSRQYVADENIASRPPIRIPGEMSPNSPEFLALMEQTIAKPYKLFTDWLSDPVTQRAIALEQLADPSLTTAQAIQKAISSGTMALPVTESEGAAFEVRKQILRHLWELALKEPGSVTPDMIGMYQEMGIQIPDTIREASRSTSLRSLDAARRSVERTDEASMNLNTMADDFADSLRPR